MTLLGRRPRTLLPWITEAGRSGLGARAALRSQRGFSLVELLVVVGMVTVMSTVAFVSYRKYINAAQASEAKAMIQGIRVGEEAYKSEALVYLGCSGNLTDWYPHDPDDKKRNWNQPTDSRYTDPAKGWRVLNVQADNPVRFGYAVVAGIAPVAFPATDFATPIAGWPPTLLVGTPWYVVQAKNKRPASPKPIVFVSSSVSAEIFVDNEDQ